MTATSVRCLGSAAVSRGDDVVTLRGAVDSMLLALLATDRHGVRTDVLLDQIWGRDDRSPMIQAIYRLRKRLGDRETIVEEGGRYRLTVEVDVWQFEDAVRAGDRPHAALALWSGDPFEGLDAPAIFDCREHLRGLRIDALLQLAQIAPTDPSTLLPIVRAGALSEPWNEQLTIAAMTAFAACDRPDAAITLAQNCRTRLLEDLDIEPSPRLEAHEADILLGKRISTDIDHQVPPASAGPVERGAPSLDRGTRLVEREPIVSALSRLVATSAIGPGRIGVVVGAAGLGKSAVVRELIEARLQSSHIRQGASREGDPIAYEPLLQALPELRSHVHLLSEARDPSVGRLLFARATETLLHDLALDHHVVLVIEDLHLIDAPSMALLSYLAERALPTGVTLLFTTRPADDPVRSTELGWLADRPIVQRLELQPLTVGGVRQLIDDRHPGERAADRARFADHVHRGSRGVPLVAELMIHAAAAGLPIDASAPLDAPLDHPYRSLLSVADRETLGIAALIGLDFDAVTLADVAELPEAHVLAVLDRAIAAEAISFGDGRFHFSHHLTRDYFASGPSELRRARVFAALAVHPKAKETEMLRYVRGAGDRLPRDIVRNALADAVTTLRAAAAFGDARSVLIELEQLTPEDDPARFDVLLALAECATRAGLMAEASRWRAEARPLCQGNADLAALAMSGLPDGEFVGGEPDRLDLFREVEPADDIGTIPESLFVRCYLRVARLAGDIAEAKRQLREWSPDRFRSDGASIAEVEFERLLIESAHDARRVHDDLASLAQSLEPGVVRASIRHRQLVAARVEQLDSYDDLHREIAAEVRGSGSALARWGVSQLEIARLIDALDPSGDIGERTEHLDRIDTMIARAHQSAVRLGVANSDQGLAAQSFLQLWNRGQLDAAAPLVREASREGVPNPGWIAASGLAAAMAGDRELAAQEIDRVLRIFAEANESNWRLTASAVVVEAASLIDMPDAASIAAAELEARSGCCVVLGAGSLSLGPVDRYLGKAAALSGAADPEPLLLGAIDQAARTGARLWEHRARVDLASLRSAATA